MHTSFNVNGQRSRSPSHLTLRPEVHHIVRRERLTNSKLCTLVEYEDPYHRQAPWPTRLKVKVARSRDASDRCWPTNRERTAPKLLERLLTPRAIIHSSFKVKGQRSRSPDRLMLRSEVCHLPNRKAYELQSWCTDGVRRPVSPWWTITSNLKGQGRDVTWCVWQVFAHKFRTKSSRNTRIGK